MGADDDATQSDSECNSDSASDVSSDSLSFESVRPRHPTVGKSERGVGEDIPAPALATPPEDPDGEIVKVGRVSPKKTKKKSKISAARAVFEEE